MNVIRSISCWSERTIRSSHQQWSSPQASAGASALPSSSVGAGPCSTAGPAGRVRLCTTASIGWPASASAWPGAGPKPARHSIRCACASVIGALSVGAGALDGAGACSGIAGGAAAPASPAAFDAGGGATLTAAVVFDGA